MSNTLKDDFLKLWEFFAWLDEARFNVGYVQSERVREQWFHRFSKAWKKCGVNINSKGLESHDIILGHWLTYIFDYAMPAERVWMKAFPIMAYVAYRFRRGVSWKKIIEEHIRPIRSDGKKNYEFYIKGPKNEQQFKHRFGAHHKLNDNVRRTLKELERKFNRDLVTFMLEKSKDSPDNRWIRDVARGLHSLTYKSNGEKQQFWHKRTWSAFRDYLKDPFCRDYICKALIQHEGKYSAHVLERWRKPEPFLDQLELPGDIWNIRFFEKIHESYVQPLMPTQYKRIKSAPKAIRILYQNVLHDEAKKRKLYPEQFDATYDFARLCGDEFCNICPLSPHDVSELCIGNLESAQEKYCPLLLSACRYFMRCQPDNCPILCKRTRGLCLQPHLP